MELRIVALERRVQQLEAAPLAEAGAPAAEAGAPAADRSASGATLQLLSRLRESVGQHDWQASPVGDPTGVIGYAGAVRVADREYLWAKEHHVSDLAGTEWTATASTLECLGSPARLVLIVALLGAPRSRAQLQEALGESSTGHLYHHLRALQSAGLLLQPRRGEYELTAQALVPLLAIIAAALDLGTGPDLSPADVE